MNRADQVREIYRELRKSVGDRATSGELIRCAASLVDLFEEQDESPSFSDRTGGVSIEEWPLDVAFADGGWRILSYEIRRRRAIHRDEVREVIMHNGLARFIQGS